MGDLRKKTCSELNLTQNQVLLSMGMSNDFEHAVFTTILIEIISITHNTIQNAGFINLLVCIMISLSF